MTIQLFFSWQMTTETKYNKNFILTCIRNAVKKLKKISDFATIQFEVLEGTTGEPGSPPVAASIADKRIPTSDIFIADISVANAQPKLKYLPEFIRKRLVGKHKPFQNNNVLFEYGVAYQALGTDKIICVLNTAYGSPTDDAANLPFDIVHLRFPIRYYYTPETEGEKEATQTKLTNELAQAIRVALVHALQTQRNKYPPLCNWRDWSEKTRLTHSFYRNQRIDKLETTIKQAIEAGSASIRLLGLSGLGKTRILLEIFRPQQDEASILFSSRVLYVNCNTSSPISYEALLATVAQDKDPRIVVLDNCPAETHRSLLPLVENARPSLFLLTVSSDPEEAQQSRIAGVNYLTINKNDLSSVVSDLLHEQLAALDEEKIAKIKEFSQGIPLMAVLLVESAKRQNEFTGMLDDKHLLNSLLGEKGKDERWRTILRSLALFASVGVEEDVRSQLEFIATNQAITISNDSPEVIKQEFYRVVHHYQQREIFEPRGRYVSIRPFPLAIYLAQEWLEVCPPARLQQVLTDIAARPEPDRHQLTAALAEQLKYLGSTRQAIEILDKLLGPGGPFDNAKVLDTELGSRLFRAFAEVNPVAVAANFMRQLGGQSLDELAALEAGRRNLVWTLEKLCFDQRTFADSARILFMLAAAENETWANNATGQLLQLFSVRLAGTEANLDERWRLLEWGLAQHSAIYEELVIKALRAGMSFGHFSRMNGAETQGTKTLQDYRPTPAEMAAYWTRIIARLATFVEPPSPHAAVARQILLNSLRGLSRAGQVQLLVPVLQRLAHRHLLAGPEARQAIGHTLRFEKDYLLDEERANLEELLTSLRSEPADFQTRYTNLSDAPALLEEGYSDDKHQQLMAALAEEFIAECLSWEEQLPSLYSQRQPYANYFGRRIHQLVGSDADQVARFIRLSLAALRLAKPDTRDQALLAGFVAATPAATRADFYAQLLADDQLRCTLFYYVAQDSTGYQHLAQLYRLVEQGHCPVSAFAELRHGQLADNLTSKQLQEMSEQLFAHGDEGYRVAFELSSSLAYHDAQLRQSLLPLLEQCVRHLGPVRLLRDQPYRYTGGQAINWLLQDASRSDLAATVNREIIADISWENDYHLDHEVQRIYELLMQQHFAAVWPELSAALLAQDDDYVKFYGLKNLLGSGIGSSSRSVGVLFEGDTAALLAWCQAEPLAPARLAELTPVFDGQEQTAPAYARQVPPETAGTEQQVQPLSQWHSVARHLLDEFGSSSDVLSSLEANLGSYSWTGSVVPLLEGERRLFAALRTHPRAAVVAWASRNLSRLDALIRQEQNRDAEWYG